MAIDSVVAFVNLVTKGRLLEPMQQDELDKKLRAKFTDPKLLARELLARDWLTSMQLNFLFQGRLDDLVLDSYVLQEKLGEGRMGTAFRGRHVHLRRVAAIKIIREELLSQPEAVERFYAEIQSTTNLDHPNILHAYDAGPVGKTHFYAMEYVAGTDLGRLVKQGGPLPVEQACDYIEQACVGLHFASERGLIHQDVRPHNLLVALSEGGDKGASTKSHSSISLSKGHREGVVKIRNLGLTQIDHELGSEPEDFDYRAPELSRPGAVPDTRSLVYSLGCTFYYLLAGKEPFPGGTAAEKQKRQATQQPETIDDLRPELPQEVAEVIQRMMAKNPAQRYQNAAEVSAALAQHASLIAGASKTNGAARMSAIIRRLGRATGLRKRRRSAGDSDRGLPAVGGGGSFLLMAAASGWVLFLLCLAAFALLWKYGSSATGSANAARADTSVKTAWEKLEAQVAEQKQGPAELRQAVHDFRWSFPGTPQAADAEALLAKMASPLDALDARQVARNERGGGLPKDVLAVLGTHRGRHAAEAMCVAFSPDGKYLASAGADKEIRVWEAATMDEFTSFRGHTGTIRSLSFAADNRTLASSADDGSVRLWDVSNRRAAEPAIVAGHKTAMLAARFAPSGRKLATAGAEKIIRIWDLDGPKPLKPIECKGHTDTITDLAFAADGTALASSSVDKTVRWWDAASGEPKGAGVFKGHAEAVTNVAYSPDGRALASASIDKTVRLWPLDGTAPGENHLLRGHVSVVRCVAYTPDSKTLVSCGDDKSIRLWDVSGPKPKAAFSLASAQPNRIQCVAFTRDGKTLASTGEDASIHLWSVEGGRLKESLTLPGHRGSVASLAFSTDMKRLASGSIDATARVWDLTSSVPQESAVLTGHGGPVVGVRFARAAKELVTGCQDNQVRIWNLEAPSKSVTSYAGILSGVGSGHAVSPDGRLIATVGADGKVNVYDLAAGKKIHDWQMPGPTSIACFAPDNRHLAVGHANGLIYLVRMP